VKEQQQESTTQLEKLPLQFGADEEEDPQSKQTDEATGRERKYHKSQDIETKNSS